MSVLVKGMEKPEHCGYCRFRYDGICHALQKTQYSMNECPLVVIDDAGLNDTISRQTAIEIIDGYMNRLAKHIGTPTDNERYAYARGTLLGVEAGINALPSAQSERKES